MKAEINGMKLEGTPQEIMQFINLKEKQASDNLLEKLRIPKQKNPYNPYGPYSYDTFTCKSQAVSSQIML